MHALNDTPQGFLRPFFLMLVSALCFLAASVIPGDSEIRQYFQAPLKSLALGSAFYLIYRGGSARLSGLLGLLLLVLVSALNNLFFLYPPSPGRLELGVLVNLLFLHNIVGWSLLLPAITAAFALAAALLEREGPYYRLFAVLAASVVLITNLILQSTSGIWSLPNDIRLIILAQLISTALAIAPAAFLARDFNETGGQILSLSIGARLWCGLVFLGLLAMLILNIVQMQPGLIQSIMLLPTTIGMVLLLFGLRGGFHLALAGVGCVVIQMIMFMPKAGEYWPIVLAALSCAVLNPVITWLLIRRSPVKIKGPKSSRRLSPIIPILETLGALVGLLLIVVAIVSLAEGRDMEPGFISLALGLPLVALQGTAAVLGFQKRGPTVLHGICLSLVAAMVIIAVLGLIFS